jgi:hypothetical protein
LLVNNFFAYFRELDDDEIYLHQINLEK